MFRVYGVENLGFQGSGFRVQGLGFRVQGLGYWVRVHLGGLRVDGVWGVGSGV